MQTRESTLLVLRNLTQDAVVGITHLLPRSLISDLLPSVSQVKTRPHTCSCKVGMQLTLKSCVGYLLATAFGPVSLYEAAALFKNMFEAAASRGFRKILLDCLPLTGELSTLERYQLGKTMADYCLSRSITAMVAVIGKPPVVNGFAVTVAKNRGLTVELFSERQAALNSLRPRLEPS